jgi:hypothetical protein
MDRQRPTRLRTEDITDYAEMKAAWAEGRTPVYKRL